ncbi:MAG: ATP-binding protein [Cystobacterineae bacterium]|nr:ATP-binding protein [Cystobacterineae bacterium]
MSIHLKVALVISSIVIAFTVVLTGISFFLTKNSLIKLTQRDSTVVAEIGRDFINTKITLLKADAKTVATKLSSAPPENFPKIFEQAKESYPDFLAFKVVDRHSVVGALSEQPAQTQGAQSNEYLRKAFLGQETISAIQRDAELGKPVIYLYSPIDDARVLSVSVSGLVFQELLGSFMLWRAGTIFLIDERGSAIVSPMAYHVQEDFNIHERSTDRDADPDIDRWLKIYADAVKTQSGTFDFTYGGGLEAIFAWQTLVGTTGGWVVGIFSPLEDSPVAEGKRMLLLSAFIVLGVSLVIVFLVSQYTARPFILIKAQNQNLKELNEAIVMANEAKSHFLANMSHEMRTPLNAVIGLAELTLNTLDEKCKPECTENLEKIFNAGSTLLNIINDILDISKINSGKFEINPVDYALPNLVSESVNQNIVRIADKPIQLKVWVDPNIPGRLWGDDLRIKQILNNLMSNAFKYTHAGTVSLNVSFEREEGNNIELLFSVEDTGSGILPENVGKIFMDYYQVDTKANRKIEGTGLGLPLTKHLVEMMDGTISVESESGKGSTFKVRIRQKQMSDTVVGQEVADSLANFSFPAAQLRRKRKLPRVHLPHVRVLVVDDMPINLDVAKGLLKPYGMQVDCVESGQAAVDLVREAQVKYDAIFMDHMMPGMDGVMATHIIRQEINSEYAREIPIIAMTANAVVGTEKMFLENGFQAFISKPVDMMRLDWVIHQWVKGKDFIETAEAGLVEEGELESFCGMEGIEGLNAAKGLRRFGGNTETYLGVINSYVQHTPALLEKVRNVRAETLVDYGIVVHGMKGSSYNIGAYAVGGLAEALEKAAKAGDFAYVSTHNAPFLEAAEKLLAMLLEKLKSCASTKPLKSELDMEMLEALRQACEAFDIDRMKQAMKALGSYEYSPGAGAELMAWLEKKAFLLDFEQIEKRLTEAQEP